MGNDTYKLGASLGELPGSSSRVHGNILDYVTPGITGDYTKKDTYKLTEGESLYVQFRTKNDVADVLRYDKVGNDIVATIAIRFQGCCLLNAFGKSSSATLPSRSSNILT